ncbi:hypothetical protein OAP56_04470, partial [Rickettsiaceae bacterium]|nr:hypothetical protein [Rickettsiaceae bacterium]
MTQHAQLITTNTQHYINDSFPSENIGLKFKSENKTISGLESKTTLVSYRKSYIAWDKLERANKPDNYTEK